MAGRALRHEVHLGFGRERAVAFPQCPHPVQAVAVSARGRVVVASQDGRAVPLRDVILLVVALRTLRYDRRPGPLRLLQGVDAAVAVRAAEVEFQVMGVLRIIAGYIAVAGPAVNHGRLLVAPGMLRDVAHLVAARTAVVAVD
jgi:hypothetical protein